MSICGTGSGNLILTSGKSSIEKNSRHTRPTEVKLAKRCQVRGAEEQKQETHPVEYYPFYSRPVELLKT
jgi:hypothetical protein